VRNRCLCPRQDGASKGATNFGHTIGVEMARGVDIGVLVMKTLDGPERGIPPARPDAQPLRAMLSGAAEAYVIVNCGRQALYSVFSASPASSKYSYGPTLNAHQGATANLHSF
jgi:hypothetical protein